MERRVGGENFIAALRHRERGGDGWKAGESGWGIRPDEEDGKKGERLALGPAVEVLAGGCYGGCPKIEFVGAREERLIKCLCRGTMHYHTPIFDHSPPGARAARRCYFCTKTGFA